MYVPKVTFCVLFHFVKIKNFTWKIFILSELPFSWFLFLWKFVVNNQPAKLPKRKLKCFCFTASNKEKDATGDFIFLGWKLATKIFGPTVDENHSSPFFQNSLIRALHVVNKRLTTHFPYKYFWGIHMDIAC